MDERDPRGDRSLAVDVNARAAGTDVEHVAVNGGTTGIDDKGATAGDQSARRDPHKPPCFALARSHGGIVEEDPLKTHFSLL